jgi:DNA-binding IclR family transcriptional regulator
VYRPPSLPKWQHRLLLTVPCFDGEPTAEEIAAATGYKLSTCKTYLCALTRAGLVAAVHRADEFGALPITYHLTQAGERIFEEIAAADAALRKLRFVQRVRLARKLRPA